MFTIVLVSTVAGGLIGVGACLLLNADIEQILLEAQHRWLRPAEICEILKNYQKFRIAPEPPNRPPSMII